MFDEFRSPTVMMSAIVTGTDNYDFNTTVTPIAHTLDHTRLLDGQIYWYHAYFRNMTSFGSEWGWGVYTAATKVLTRNPIMTSNSDNLVVWPASTDVVVAISASEEMMTQFAVSFARKPPNEAGLMATGGQSQFHNSNILTVQAPLATDPYIWDWSTDGLSPFDRADLAWRLVNFSDVYQYGLIHVGVPRARDQGGTQYTAHMGYEACRELRQITGRPWCIINTARPATGINDPDGWVYDPGSGNTLDVWSEEIANGIATPPAGLTLPASPDIVAFGQGETDAFNGMNSGVYANHAFELYQNCSDPNRYGWSDPNRSVWLFTEMPKEFNEDYPTFNGHGILDEITPDDVKIVSSYGGKTHDAIHFEGESAVNTMGPRIARIAATASRAPVSGVGSFKADYNWKDLSEVVTVWQFAGISETAPANGFFNHNAAEDKLRLAKIDGNFFGARDHSGIGIQKLHREGCVITFQQYPGIDVNYRRYTVAALPVDLGTYWEWDVVSYEEGGTPPAGATFVEIRSDRRINDSELVAKSDLALASNKLSLGTEVDTHSALNEDGPFEIASVFLDETGVLRRRAGLQPSFLKKTLTLDQTTGVLASFLVPENSHCYVEFNVFGKHAATNSILVAKLKAIGRRDAGSWIQINKSIENVFSVTDISVDVQVGLLNTVACTLTSTNHTDEVWHFNIDMTVLAIADAPT